MRQAKTSLSQQIFQSCNKQFSQRQRSNKEICHDIFRVCRDTEFSLSSARQQDYVVTKKGSIATTAHATVRNFVTKKENIVTINV